MIGSILHDRYEIIEEIGTGGMATVYLAYCSYLKRKVAIKVLHNFDDDVKEDLLIAEAKAIARANHANIVQVYDIFEEAGKTYIVMEYVDGITLKNYLKKSGPMLEDEIISLSAKLSSALSNAHTNGVIHRDIKPDNIILDHSGEPKITDFGIAHVSNENTIIRSDQIFGSLRYASPEQLKGNVIDERSDIYSLGVVMYEMATGTTPFPDESPVTAAFRKLKEPLPSVRTINPNISPVLSQIILNATNINVSDRYHSMLELYSDLKKITAKPLRMPVYTVEEPRKKAVYKVSEPAQRSFRPLFLGMLVGLLLGSIILLTILGSAGSPAESMQVPDVRNMDYEQAMKTLNEKGFYASAAKLTASADIAAGKVISMNPAAGQSADYGTSIALEISSGAQQSTVPKFIDLTQEVAAQLAAAEGLVPTFEQAASDTAEPGIIFEQSLAQGQTVKSGTTIVLKVSQGPEAIEVPVPDLSNQTYNLAATMLETSKLVMGQVTYEFSDTVPESRIISQSTQAGEKLTEGSEVSVVISKGREVAIPPTQTTEPEVVWRTMAASLDIDSYAQEILLVTAQYTYNGKTVQVYSKQYDHSTSPVQFTFKAPLKSFWQILVDGKPAQEGTVR